METNHTIGQLGNRLIEGLPPCTREVGRMQGWRTASHSQIKDHRNASRTQLEEGGDSVTPQWYGPTSYHSTYPCRRQASNPRRREFGQGCYYTPHPCRRQALNPRRRDFAQFGEPRDPA